MRTMNKQIRELVSLRDDEVYEAAKQLAVPYDLAKYVHATAVCRSSTSPPAVWPPRPMRR